MKAFIFDPLWDDLITPELEEKLQGSGLKVLVFKDIAPLSQCKKLFEGDEDRILCLNPDYVAWKLQSLDYEGIPNLKGIFTASTAYSWLDSSYADSHNIPICNIRNFSTEAVAEWAITMMFNVARQIPKLIKDGFPLDFDKDYMKYRGIELHGKKAGIVGLGRIGSAIAKRCEGLGMEIIYYNRSPKTNSYKKLELEDVISESDVIFPTLTFNSETRSLLKEELLNTMKPSAMLIGIEHHLFNLESVLRMVASDRLYGFGFEAEPDRFNDFSGNVWAAPAYAWATDTTMLNSLTSLIENIIAAANGQYPNRVN
jgi:lactate dehydrogenase-like 2-hydroxyacid dehydrogenase